MLHFRPSSCSSQCFWPCCLARIGGFRIVTSEPWLRAPRFYSTESVALKTTFAMPSTCILRTSCGGYALRFGSQFGRMPPSPSSSWERAPVVCQRPGCWRKAAGRRAHGQPFARKISGCRCNRDHPEPYGLTVHPIPKALSGPYKNSGRIYI